MTGVYVLFNKTIIETKLSINAPLSPSGIKLVKDKSEKSFSLQQECFISIEPYFGKKLSLIIAAPIHLWVYNLDLTIYL